MRRSIYIFVIIFLLGFFSYFIYITVNQYKKEIEEQKQIKTEYEKECAIIKNYKETINPNVETISTNVEATDSQSNVHLNETLDSSSQPSYSTSALYKYYDGEIECVLNIPSINLEKLVLRGDNRKNLAKFLLCVGSEYSKLNETAYTIMGHDSYVKGCSLNQLRYVNVDDQIFLLSNDKQYAYTVQSIQMVTRKEFRNFVDINDKDNLYIFTCDKTYDENHETKIVLVFAKKNN